jgi:hypothetical protein
MASELASHGRKTDSMVMHISPEELEMMEELFPGNLTVNPDTGMIEAWAWLAAVGKAIAAGASKVGPAIAEGVSKVGPALEKGISKAGTGLSKITEPLGKVGTMMGGQGGYGEAGGLVGPAQDPGLLGGLQENVSTFKGGLNNMLDKTGTTQEQRSALMGAYNQGKGGGGSMDTSSLNPNNFATGYPGPVTNAGVNPVAGGAVDPYAGMPPGAGQSLLEMYGKRSGGRGRASEQRRMREMMMSMMGPR